MKKLFSVLLLCFSAALFAANPSVLIDTSMGKITVELYSDEAPKTVDNFLNYVQVDGFKNTIFHRVINGFMIQGGGLKTTGGKARSNAPVKNESFNTPSNKRGTIAMARTSAPHSATRQFFINQKDNTFLDAKGSNHGYAVFGKVTSGMEVVDKIAKVKTISADKPVKDVIIHSISLLN
jgi:peptidyl-prolyl cis-trans isomerase A (cyclophilin A)/peptidyl-prolyl cis-trans isomerase B (cyclophilin B)